MRFFCCLAVTIVNKYKKYNNLYYTHFSILKFMKGLVLVLKIKLIYYLLIRFRI
jgi:hypothetical protein